MKRRTSKEVFGEALLALARTESVERITVKQIVEASGLSLQTFYNHFRAKEDLILWLYRRGGERALAKLEGRQGGFHELCMDSIRFYRENGSFLRASLEGPCAEAAADSAFAFLSAFVCRRLNRETLPEELGFYLHMYVYACLHIFRVYSRKGWDLPEERLAAYLEQGMPEKLKPWLLC